MLWNYEIQFKFLLFTSANDCSELYNRTSHLENMNHCIPFTTKKRRRRWFWWRRAIFLGDVLHACDYKLSTRICKTNRRRSKMLQLVRIIHKKKRIGFRKEENQANFHRQQNRPSFKNKKCMFSRVNHMSYVQVWQKIYDLLRLPNNKNR